MEVVCRGGLVVFISIRLPVWWKGSIAWLIGRVRGWFVDEIPVHRYPLGLLGDRGASRAMGLSENFPNGVREWGDSSRFSGYPHVC